MTEKILKVVNRGRDKFVFIPRNAFDRLGGSSYVKCTVDEKGIHYRPFEVLEK
jgi:hypothetical protein